MPTYANFKLDIAAFMNRSATALTIGGRDMILAASNMAKAEAQRRHDFKYNRARAFISTSLAGAALSDAKTTPGGATAITIKLVEGAWLYTTVSSSYYRTERIPFITSGDQRLYYPTGDVGTMIAPNSPPQYVPQSLACWIQGPSIYLTGTTTAQAIMLDVIKWMDDYDGSNSDFLLTQGYDWLVLKTLDYLNFLLKDDQRYPISVRRLETAWDSLISWDENHAEKAFDINNDD
jgi:hypothetical protein